MPPPAVVVLPATTSVPGVNWPFPSVSVYNVRLTPAMPFSPLSKMPLLLASRHTRSPIDMGGR